MKKPNYIHEIISILGKYFKVDISNSDIYNLFGFNVFDMISETSKDLKESLNENRN